MSNKSKQSGLVGEEDLVYGQVAVIDEDEGGDEDGELGAEKKYHNPDEDDVDDENVDDLAEKEDQEDDERQDDDFGDGDDTDDNY